MSKERYPPFLKWGSHTSRDKENPNVLKVEPIEDATFETEFSTNLRAKVDGIEMNIPLQNFESKNKQLLRKFLEAQKKGKIQVGKAFKIKTWKESHPTKKGFEIRKYELVF